MTSLVARGVSLPLSSAGWSAAANDAAPSNVEEDAAWRRWTRELALAALSGGGAHGATEGGSKGAGAQLLPRDISQRPPSALSGTRLPLLRAHAGVLTLSYGGRPAVSTDGVSHLSLAGRAGRRRPLWRLLRHRKGEARGGGGGARRARRRRGARGDATSARRWTTSVKFAQQAANQAAAQMVASRRRTRRASPGLLPGGDRRARRRRAPDARPRRRANH